MKPSSFAYGAVSSVVGMSPAWALIPVTDGQVQALVAAACILMSGLTQLCLALTHEARERRADRKAEAAERRRLQQAARTEPGPDNIDRSG